MATVKTVKDCPKRIKGRCQTLRHYCCLQPTQPLTDCKVALSAKYTKKDK